jgi:photosystem II stability/assembly factor-like uncharacterized protein
MIRRAILLALLCLGPVTGRASSSWQVRSFPEGSGRWVTTTNSDALRVFGSFEGGMVWDTRNAGLSGSLLSATVPFPVDSIASVADEGEMLVYDGYAWHRDYPTWVPFILADSIGTVTAAGGNWWAGSAFTFGNTAGVVFRGNSSNALKRIGDFQGVQVRRFFGRGDEGVRLLLADGRLLVQNDGWTESPMRASVAGFWDDRLGYAIEKETLRLWNTTDAGLHWAALSETLATPTLAVWAARARSITIDDSGHGVIPCGDAILMTGDGGTSWIVAAVGEEMFLDAAIDSEGNVLTVGRRLHRCAGGSFDFEQVAGADFGRVMMGSNATLWALDDGLLLSVDQGSRWFRQAIPDAPGRLRRIAALGDYDLWLHFDGQEGSRTYRTRDRGNSFVLLDPPGLLHGAIAWSIPDSLSAWAATREAVLRSVDGGAHWSVTRDRLDGIQALAAVDSLQAAVRTATAFIHTTDGGVSWIEGPTPPTGAFTAIDFTPDGGWAAAGTGLYRASPTDPWNLTASIAAGDTLRDLSIAPDGTGWSVGTSGLVLGTDDSGRSWNPYRVNLELNAIDTTFVQLCLLDSGDGVTGAGTKLIRFLPDRSGPIFRIGVSANPFLPRRVDIHITALERLRGDSLRVRVDGVDLAATLIDPDGYLYRARFEIPADPTEQLLTVSGRDWGGNERSDARALLALVLDRDGRADALWNGQPIRFAGGADAAVMLLGGGGEFGMPPPDASITGAPFTVVAMTPTTLAARDSGIGMIRWDGDRWVPADGEMIPPGAREIRAFVRREGGSANNALLRVFPVPSRDECTIQWNGSTVTAGRWELFDLAGRKVASGILPAEAGRTIHWRAVDAAGRALPAGVYWLRASADGKRATRRILIER